MKLTFRFWENVMAGSRRCEQQRRRPGSSSLWVSVILGAPAYNPHNFTRASVALASRGLGCLPCRIAATRRSWDNI